VIGFVLVRADSGDGAPSPIPSPTSSPVPTPFAPTSWELSTVILPAGHEDGVIYDISPDGSLIAFRDADVYDPAYLSAGGRAPRELVPPGHTQGAPVGVQMFPDGQTLLIGELAHVWLYNIATGAFDLIPDPPDGGSGTYVLTDGRIVVLTGSVASHEFGGVTDSKLWMLDSTMESYTQLGTRTDGISMIPMTNAVALITDRSPDHDNSQWFWYRIGFDGSESLIHEFEGPPGCFALALDGTLVAVSRMLDGEGGTWLVDVAGGGERRISDGCPVSFSPDGLQLAVYFSDGHTEAIALDGTILTSIASNQFGWIGVP
jgi:hypothetical protein